MSNVCLPYPRIPCHVYLQEEMYQMLLHVAPHALFTCYQSLEADIDRILRQQGYVCMLVRDRRGPLSVNLSAGLRVKARGEREKEGGPSLCL